VRSEVGGSGPSTHYATVAGWQHQAGALYNG
jgi:hypothetical protein